MSFWALAARPGGHVTLPLPPLPPLVIEITLLNKKSLSLCLARWMELVQRHPESPACLILSVQDDLWLETMRALLTADGSDSALRAGRTGTRSGRGRPIRWSAGWVTAVKDTFGWANSLRDKGLTRERASVIEAILSFGTWHGIRAVDL